MKNMVLQSIGTVVSDNCGTRVAWRDGNAAALQGLETLSHLQML